LSLGVIATFTAAQFCTVEAAPKPSEGVPLTLAADAPPIIDLNVPTTVLVGEDVSFSVTFDNQDTDPGYGPFIDLIIDTTGTDGYDGLGGSTITASYLGIPIASGDLYIQVFDGSGQLSHPFVRLNDGSYLQVLGQPGDTLVSIRLPFGSFTPDQPPATLQVTVDMSNLADVGVPLTVQARGGYEFGYTPLDDWCCGDAAYPGAVTGWDSGTITPTLFTLSKTYSGPEDETATGPNYPRQYTVTVDIADGQVLTDLDLSDVLPDDMQYVSVDSVTIHGAPAGSSAISTPSTSSPGGTLTRRLASVTGSTSGDDASMTFTFYVPRDDSIPARILDPVTGDDFTSCNNAATSASWIPLDPADTGGVQSIDPADCEHELVEKSIAMQKGVSVLTAGNLRPGSVLEYTLQMQVSDFFAFDGLVVTDTFSDGQHFDATFTPTLQVQGNTYTLVTSAMNVDNYSVDISEIGNDPDPSTDGSTTLIFELSDELVTRGQSDRLIGGCVPTGGSASPDCNLYDEGATTATIVFRTVVLENFTDTYPSTDTSVDQGDLLENVGDVSGYVLDTLTFARQGSRRARKGTAAALR
jgi:hypothetical protein